MFSVSPGLDADEHARFLKLWIVLSAATRRRWHRLLNLLFTNVAGLFFCEACLTLLRKDRELELSDDSETIDYSYVQSLDRGGLKYPTLLAILLGHKVLSVLQVLVSKKYENKFLQLQTQKAVTHAIVLQLLSQDDFFQSEASDKCVLLVAEITWTY